MWIDLLSTAWASTGSGGLPWNQTSDIVVGSVLGLGVTWFTGSIAWMGIQAMHERGMEHMQAKLINIGVGGGIIVGAKPITGVIAAAAGASALTGVLPAGLSEQLGELVGHGLYWMWLALVIGQLIQHCGRAKDVIPTPAEAV